MAFPSYSGPLKNPFNDISNEDDEFGDFTSAVTFPAIGSCNGEAGFQVSLPVQVHPLNKIPSNSVFFNPIPDSDNDDEFGDFCGPSVDHTFELSMVVPVTPDSSVSLPQENSGKKCQPNYDIDLDEDLTGVSQLTWNSQKEEEKAVDDEEEFTNFTSAEPVCPSLEVNSIFPLSQQIPQPIVEEIFSALGEVSLDLPSTLQSLEHVPDSKTDDEFGDFTQASSVASVNASAVEDLFSLDAVPSFSLESPGVPNPVNSFDYFDQQEEEQQPHFAAITDVVEAPQISWDEPLEKVDPLSVTVGFDEDKPKLSEDVKVAEELIQEEEDDEFVFHKNVATIPHVEFPDFQTEPTIDAQVEDDGNIEEFGDFTDFQTATSEAVAATSEDDEFDDFEIAPHPSTECIQAQPTELPAAATTPETHIQRMLTTLFPVNSPSSTESELQPSTIPLSNSPGGSLWSYVSQLDSTPALSFSWKHSAAQQRFLHSLRIDSVLQAGNVGGFRWNSPPSVNSSSTSMSESFAEPTVTLDLDFFLNPSTASSATSNAVPASSTLPTNTSDSILETIERELLSPQGKGLRNQVVPPPTTQSPALPVRHNNNQLSDIFQHLHLQDNANHSSVTNRQVDLLQ
ncbi:LOW QUALITY PROTEIN: uncharacterized protein LOC116930146 [Daphnia magna]|uniref:LOW QUALITY PROTEIN: uncharacterized protein LOC116930146 n=1 Tax=Daphnia magna TaxID=35525 RepID=UPI001E1BAA03|nr:LOW QUALITY PROTEIN: uncharacterized protein LOC116930146 [Daphnia magna]